MSSSEPQDSALAQSLRCVFVSGFLGFRALGLSGSRTLVSMVRF